MIVVADSSPLITLARGQHFELLHEFYGEIIVSREVYEEIAVAGNGLPGAEEMRRAPWIQLKSVTTESSMEVTAASLRLGVGERSVIHLAFALSADLVLIDEERARRVAKGVGLRVAGSIAILERGAKLGRVGNLRAVFLNLLDQGILYDHGLLNQSLMRVGLSPLTK